MANMNDRPYIYWKQDPQLNLVKIDNSVKNPQYDPQTNARIKEMSVKVIATAKAFMDDLFKRDLVTESKVMKANLTGDPAHDMYPDRAVIKAALAIDKQTGQPKLYEGGAMQGLPIINFTADIGHESSHAVLDFSYDGEIRNVKGREVMGRGEQPKWFFTEEEINNSPLLSGEIKKIIEVAREYTSADFSQSIEIAKKVNLPSLATDFGLNLVTATDITTCQVYRCEDIPSIYFYQRPDGSWKWQDFAEDKNGNAVDFVQEFEKVSFKEAVLRICDFENQMQAIAKDDILRQ